MNSAEANLNFPVLCFMHHMEIWSAADLTSLTTWSKYALRPTKAEVGMELVDTQGRRFIVRSIRVLPREGAWVLRPLQALTGRPKMRRVALKLDPLPTVSLEEVKVRFIASLLNKPRFEEGEYDDVPGRYCPPPAKRALNWVSKANSIEELSDRRWMFSIEEYIGPGSWTIADLYGGPRPKGRIAFFGGGPMGD